MGEELEGREEEEEEEEEEEGEDRGVVSCQHSVLFEFWQRCWRILMT